MANRKIKSVSLVPESDESAYYCVGCGVGHFTYENTGEKYSRVMVFDDWCCCFIKEDPPGNASFGLTLEDLIETPEKNMGRRVKIYDNERRLRVDLPRWCCSIEYEADNGE